MMMSMAVVGLFWKLLYDPSWGTINYALGLGNFDWLSNPDMALYAVAITDIWMWAPFVMLLSLAGLSAVPKHLYEAAAIDRAGAWYTFSRITLPLVAPILLIAIIFRTMEAFKTFDLAFIMTQPADHRADLDPALQDGVPGMADRPVLRAGLHRADHGAGDHQHLREVPEQGEGALRWRPSRRHARRIALNRLAIVAVLVITADLPGADLLDHLDRLQAAQPGDHGAADGVVHSRRSRPSSSCSPSACSSAGPVDPAIYAAAPWWEKAIYRRRRAGAQGRRDVQLSPIPTAS